MNAYLLLANGMVFAGQSVGAEGVTVGEVVFATGMVGFEETLTDPSYYGQIITQTYPLIGNYGMNKDDMESDRIWAKGYIVREACTTPSNWRCEETLDSFLKKNNTIGIEGIDTRHLTRIIRESGVMNGAILTTFDPADPANKAETEKLLETIRAYACLLYTSCPTSPSASWWRQRHTRSKNWWKLLVNNRKAAAFRVCGAQLLSFCRSFVQFLRIVPPCQRLPYEESWPAKWDREVQRCCFWMTSWRCV